jgi:hypothetical protein
MSMSLSIIPSHFPGTDIKTAACEEDYSYKYNVKLRGYFLFI